MKIGICDDNPQDLETLRAALIPVLGSHTALECYDHGFALLESHCQKPFDILFLDIVMPHLSGIEVARELRLTSQSTLIIFVTRYRDYAAESYAVQAFSYLTKPFRPDELRQIFRQAEHKRLSHGRLLAVRTDCNTVYLQTACLVFAETRQHNKLRLHTYTEVLDTRITMQDLARQLDGQGFYRLHNSYLINLACVRSIQNRCVFLDGGISIPIGKTRPVTEIKAAIRLWRELP